MPKFNLNAGSVNRETHPHITVSGKEKLLVSISVYFLECSMYECGAERVVYCKFSKNLLINGRYFY